MCKKVLINPETESFINDLKREYNNSIVKPYKKIQVRKRRGRIRCRPFACQGRCQGTERCFHRSEEHTSETPVTSLSRMPSSA